MINPKVTVFCVVKNGEKSIHKAIDSILNQDYINKEVLVQAGESSDGTDRILKEYGDKITFLKDKESCPGEAFWKTFKRCNGEIICCLMADEIMQEGALTKAVSEFSKDQEVEVITGDIYGNDLINNSRFPIKGMPFNLRSFLTSEYSPHLSATYFKKVALKKIDLDKRDWDYDIGEVELWYYLNLKCKIKYIPFTFSEYTISKSQLSCNLEMMTVLYERKMQFLKDKETESIDQTLKDLNYFSLKRFGVIISSHKLNPFSVFIKSKRLRGVIIDAIKFKNYEVVKEFFRNK